MSNPWLKKNPFLSMWMSGANAVAGAARGRATAEINRQTKAAAGAATSEFIKAFTAPIKPATRASTKRRR